MSLIAELKPEQSVKGNYLCKYKQTLKNKNGKDYCTIRLQDKTGVVDGKIWSIHAGIEACEVDDVVYIEGETLLYQDNMQLNINKLAKAEVGTYELKEFIPHTKKDVDTLETELFEFIEHIQNPFIKKVLEAIFYDEHIYSMFSMNGAAKTVHHAYLNGLLEHTVGVAKIGEKLASLYEIANKDLVIAGCLLHDLGKIYELSAFPKNDYTDEGQLLGHIMIGIEKLNDKIREIPDFPYEEGILLKHIVLAHHGEYEYASPKRPKCIEAMIVHLADHSDSKLKMMEEMIIASNDEEIYAGYHKILNRNIRKSQL